MARNSLKPYLITSKSTLSPLNHRYSLFHNLYLTNNTLHPSSLQPYSLKFVAIPPPQGSFRKDAFFFHRDFFSSLVMRRRNVSGSPNFAKRFQSLPFLLVNGKEVRSPAITFCLNYISRSLLSRKRRSQLLNKVLGPRVRAIFSLRSTLNNANGKLLKTVVSFTRQAHNSVNLKAHINYTNSSKNVSFIIWARLFTALLFHSAISRDPLVWPLTYYIWLWPWSKKIRCFGYNWFTRRVYYKYTAVQQWYFKRSLILKDCYHYSKNLLLPLPHGGIARTVPHWIRFFLVTGIALKVWSILIFRLRQIFIHIFVFTPQKTNHNFYTRLRALARVRYCYFKSLFMHYFFTIISQEKIVKLPSSRIAKYYFSSTSAIKITPHFQFTLASTTASLNGTQITPRICNVTAPTSFLQYSPVWNSHYYSFFTSRLNSNVISFFTKPVANQLDSLSLSTYSNSSLYSVSSLRTSFRFGFIRDWWGFAKETLERHRGAVSAPNRRSVRSSLRH